MQARLLTQNSWQSPMLATIKGRSRVSISKQPGIGVVHAEKVIKKQCQLF